MLRQLAVLFYAKNDTVSCEHEPSEFGMYFPIHWVYFFDIFTHHIEPSECLNLISTKPDEYLNTLITKPDEIVTKPSEICSKYSRKPSEFRICNGTNPMNVTPPKVTTWHELGELFIGKCAKPGEFYTK